LSEMYSLNASSSLNRPFSSMLCMRYLFFFSLSFGSLSTVSDKRQCSVGRASSIRSTLGLADLMSDSVAELAVEAALLVLDLARFSRCDMNVS